VGGYHLTAGAEAEFGEILQWSESRFGAAARERYAALVLTALRNIADDPIRRWSIGIGWERPR
jgi:toxin ParE1/3/4